MIFYIVLALVGVSIIIFIHESGHYLAAKKAGVRVERFSLGFDPPFRGRPLRFFSFRVGETEYILGMIPFGGYVKLAGEAIADPSKEPAPDELLSKSVGARALVFAAGSIMNVLSAFLFFMIAFTLGVSFLAPTVGSAVPEMPGWEAGLRPGDRIVEVDGKKIVDFTEMRLAVVLGTSERPREFKVERPLAGGGTETVSLRVTPRFDEDLGFSEIGVRPAYSDVLGKPKAGSAAAAAGLREGDRVVGVALEGRRLPPLPPTALMEAIHVLALGPGRTLDLEVARGTETVSVRLEPRKAAGKKPAAQIGVQPGAGTIVAAIQPGSAAAERFRPGDEIRAAGGERVHAMHWVLVAERWRGTDGMLELEVVSKDGTVRPETMRWDDFLRWNLLGEIAWGGHEVVSVEPGSALTTAGVRAGDVLDGLDGRKVLSLTKLEEALEGPVTGNAVLRILREGKPEEITVDRKALKESAGVAWAEMPPVAACIPGGPADAAGIETGSRFLRAGSKRVLSWKDLTEVVSDTDPGQKIEVAWRAPDGTERSAAIEVGLDAMEVPPIEEDMTTVHAGILASFGLGLQRTVVTTKQIFLTLKSLIRREVATKNLAGPVGITHLLTKVVEQGNLSTLIYFLALISINLGLFNLLPFPILDGGHLLFLAIEKVKGSPVDVRIQEWAMNIAFLLILALAVWVTYNDIHRLIG